MHFLWDHYHWVYRWTDCEADPSISERTLHHDDAARNRGRVRRHLHRAGNRLVQGRSGHRLHRCGCRGDHRSCDLELSRPEEIKRLKQTGPLLPLLTVAPGPELTSTRPSDLSASRRKADVRLHRDEVQYPSPE